MIGKKVEDGQALRIGRAEFWMTTRFSCVCGKSFRWFPRPLPKEDEEIQIARSLLDELGKEGEERNEIER